MRRNGRGRSTWRNSRQAAELRPYFRFGHFPGRRIPCQVAGRRLSLRARLDGDEGRDLRSGLRVGANGAPGEKRRVRAADDRQPAMTGRTRSGSPGWVSASDFLQGCSPSPPFCVGSLPDQLTLPPSVCVGKLRPPRHFRLCAVRFDGLHEGTVASPSQRPRQGAGRCGNGARRVRCAKAVLFEPFQRRKNRGETRRWLIGRS